MIQLAILLLSAVAATDPWGMLAQRDLTAMHDAILANHPGPADSQNPEFRKWLDDGYAEAMRRAASVKTFGGYHYALRFYGAGFRDGHLQSGLMVTSDEMAWPGFAVALRGGGKYVVGAVADPKDATLPPAGSEIVDCDGRTPRTIVEEDVWPYVLGPKLDSAWTNVAGSMLLDRGNPWMKRPASCRFRIGDALTTLPLRYRETSVDAFAKVVAASRASLAPQPAARPVGNNGVWVSIPSFYDADPDALSRLRELVRLAPEWRGAAFVVFDVRSNSGGNSSWGDDILRALYGAPYLDRVMRPKFDGQYVEWRVSKDNLQHVRNIVSGIRARKGSDDASAKRFEEIANGMAAELARNNTGLFRPAEDGSTDEEAGAAADPMFKGRVVLLTDSRCASACLDFADRIHFLPGSLHAGLTTSADSVYMEVRPVTLPSGIGRLGLPVKVYRHRPRGHNEPYVPQAPYAGDINDTQQVETWLVNLLTPLQ